MKVTVSSECVKRMFTSFSDREASVIAALAEGRTIKQVAGYLDRSHVTVAIQARTALKKTPYATLNSFLPLVIITCGSVDHENSAAAVR